MADSIKPEHFEPRKMNIKTDDNDKVEEKLDDDEIVIEQLS